MDSQNLGNTQKPVQTAVPQAPVVSEHPVPQTPPSPQPVTPASPMTPSPVAPPPAPPTAATMHTSDSHHFDPKALFIVFALFVCAMVGFLIITTTRKKPESTITNASVSSSSSTASLEPTPVVYETKGGFTLTPVETTVAVDQNVTYTLKANTDAVDIVAYDLILSFNPEEFEFVDAQSLLPEFMVKTYDRKTYIAITGIKTDAATEGTVLTDTDLLTVTVKPKKQGALNLSLTGTDKEKTKFVDSKTQIFMPEVVTIGLEVN